LAIHIEGSDTAVAAEVSGAPIHLADQSEQARRPISNQLGTREVVIWLWSSQTCTVQK